MHISWTCTHIPPACDRYHPARRGRAKKQSPIYAPGLSHGAHGHARAANPRPPLPARTVRTGDVPMATCHRRPWGQAPPTARPYACMAHGHSPRTHPCPIPSHHIPSLRSQSYRTTSHPIPLTPTALPISPQLTPPTMCRPIPSYAHSMPGRLSLAVTHAIKEAS